MNSKNRLDLCLHAHFFQPQRENPLTGIIGRQESASPYINWNEKIYSDCYSANAHSRYLNEYGKIKSITNNYEHLSFDFGPTLLHWIEKYHYSTYELILDADRLSKERLGHGNAIAHPFNHTILALESAEDQKVQIDWGVTDFSARFKRDPEGIWLPEAAINPDVIDSVAEFGIKFVIISPRQCKRIGNKNYKDGIDVPTDRPFIIEGRKGRRIACFFYNQKIADDISFNHILTSADNLYHALLNEKNKGSNFIQSATDGEIYGHYEPYADMALSALIKKIEQRDDFNITNYATFLENHEANEVAELYRGSDGIGSSWSAVDGLERWYKKIEQNNVSAESLQLWRMGLRTALNRLIIKEKEVFNKEVNNIFKGKISAHELLHLAARTITRNESMEDFLTRLHGHYDFDKEKDGNVTAIISAMMMNKISLNSSGFFFSDVSELDPRQNIRYALYSIELLQPYCDGDLLLPFLSDLRKVKSSTNININAMDIACEELKGLKGDTEAAIAFYLNFSFARPLDTLEQYGKFRLKSFERNGNKTRVSIWDMRLLRKYEYEIVSLSTIEWGIDLYLTVREDNQSIAKHYRIFSKDIPEYLTILTSSWIDTKLNEVTYNESASLIRNLYNFALLAKNNSYLPLLTETRENLGLAQKIIKSSFAVSLKTEMEEGERIRLDTLIEFVTRNGDDDERGTLMALFSSFMDKMAESIHNEGLRKENARNLIGALRLVRRNGYEPDTTTAQNEVYPYYTGKKTMDERITESQREEIFADLNFE